MNDTNIFIDSSRFENVIASMSSIKEKLVSIRDSQITSAKNISDNWGGEVGEDISYELNNHIEMYDKYISNIDEKIAFLKNVKELYTSTDIKLDQKIDNNLNYN